MAGFKNRPQTIPTTYSYFPWRTNEWVSGFIQNILRTTYQQTIATHRVKVKARELRGLPSFKSTRHFVPMYSISIWKDKEYFPLQSNFTFLVNSTICATCASCASCANLFFVSPKTNLKKNGHAIPCIINWYKACPCKMRHLRHDFGTGYGCTYLWYRQGQRRVSSSKIQLKVPA